MWSLFATQNEKDPKEKHSCLRASPPRSSPCKRPFGHIPKSLSSSLEKKAYPYLCPAFQWGLGKQDSSPLPTLQTPGTSGRTAWRPSTPLDLPYFSLPREGATAHIFTCQGFISPTFSILDQALDWHLIITHPLLQLPIGYGHFIGCSNSPVRKGWPSLLSLPEPGNWAVFTWPVIAEQLTV